MMADDRLPAAVEAAGLVRTVAANGGFAAILRRGDPDRGALILIINSRGEYVSCLQRRFDVVRNSFAWEQVGPERSKGSEELPNFLEQQARFDPDSWQIELDIAQAERFIAETTASG
jgi:hypothetical protein